MNAAHPGALSGSSGATTVSPQYLIERTMAYVPSGDQSNYAGFFDQQPNYGMCRGGFPFHVLDFMAQYGAATCDAEDCSSGHYPHTCPS